MMRRGVAVRHCPEHRDEQLALFASAQTAAGEDWCHARPGAPIGPDVVVVRNEETRRVIVALDARRPSDGEVLMLSAWEELTASQIAQVLGVFTSAAEQRLHRARKRLARALPAEPERSRA